VVLTVVPAWAGQKPVSHGTTVDPEVAEALGSDGVRLLQNPLEVETYRVAPPSDATDATNPSTIDGLNVIAQGTTLQVKRGAGMGSLFLSSRLYDRAPSGTGSQKSCGFFPSVVLRFRASTRSDDDSVDVLVGFQCNEVGLLRTKGHGRQKAGAGAEAPWSLAALLAADPGRDTLLALAIELFPDDMSLHALSVADAHEALVRRRFDAELIPAVRRAVSSQHADEWSHQRDRDGPPLQVDAAPFEVARSAFRALGVAMPRAFLDVSDREDVLIRAVAGLRDADVHDAMNRLRGDRVALMGVACLFFRHGLAERLPTSVRAEWSGVLADVMIGEGITREIGPDVYLDFVRYGPAPRLTDTLRRAARGEIPERMDGPVVSVPDSAAPGTSEAAYLSLAWLLDQSVADELKRVEQKDEPESLALETARALLGEWSRLRGAAFDSKSRLVARAALEVVRRSGGAVGLDSLVSSTPKGVDELPAWQVFAELLGSACQVTPGSAPEHQHEAMESCWKAHGEEFKKSHPPPTESAAVGP
jgi:hypothetical protein